MALALSGRVAAAQQASVPQIKEVPCAAIASVEGNDNYAAYCAACHGAGGKGDGPAAPALKGPVPDLTTLASRHGGKFNALSIERLIEGTGKVPTAHGTSTMPTWGPIFRAAQADRAVTSLRLQNLVKYLQSIQAS
jgi:mono/diheme cytochrome c family protein